MQASFRVENQLTQIFQRMRDVHSQSTPPNNEEIPPAQANQKRPGSSN